MDDYMFAVQIFTDTRHESVTFELEKYIKFTIEGSDAYDEQDAH